MEKLLTQYLKDIADTEKRGDAREETFYPALKTLFSGFPLEKGRRTDVTQLPKQTEAGNPDFRVWDGDHFIVGYIEAKAPGTNLDQAETSEQLERYLNTFPNVILTDFYEFRLYRNGIMIDRAIIGRLFTARTLKTTPPLENIDAFEKLANRFFSFKLPKTFTAESLAVELAKRTRFLRDQVVAEELRESERGKGAIYGFYQAFQKYLITSLTPQQFADLYSQTIAYGLFAARTRADGDFNRKIAFDYIPQSIGILREVFQFISLGNLSDQMEVIVDDITAVLNAADINSILDQYYKEGRGEDPIVHFYETFLNQYDPQTRERRGVYYTPEPVVKYIVRSVHSLLKTRFGLRDGLADPSVTVLDPAAGTLTFPAEAIRLAVEEYVGKYGQGGKQGFIRNQILKNFYALELMMAPYAIGHMKISYLLESLGYQLQGDDSFQLYLTNTLEMEEIEQISIPGISALSVESRLAGKVKREPIMVIMGNPPYSGISANKNAWTEKLLKTDVDGAQGYYTVDDKPLGERNPKMLQDDYVKFLRFAQWKIHKAGKGVVAMITNHAYLDNPTFRGMRQSLMKTFDEVFILDLHGNSLKKETAPDGGRDENVFDIRLGVAIILLIKQYKNAKFIKAIKHSNLFGLRSEKYHYLTENQLNTIPWKEIHPKSKFYFFIPRDSSSEKKYYQLPAITDIFIQYSSGIKTHRDHFVYDIGKDALLRRIRQFRDMSNPDEIIASAYNLRDTSSWNLGKSRRELSRLENLDSYVFLCLYRPFDIQNIFYHPSLVDRNRFEVMQHMLDENIGLTVGRQGQVVGKQQKWNLAFISDKIVDVNLYYRGGAVLLPLYLNKENQEFNLFNQDSNGKQTNILPQKLTKLMIEYDDSFSPENILYYIYAVLYSNIYRISYADFLNNDYPRIPFTKDPELFIAAASLGRRLANLHLLKSPELDQPTVKYQGQGDDHTIGKPSYNEDEQRVYINKTHYFEGVPPAVWAYQIGGYQVLDKYLKDRRGRKMDDPRHYIHIATALEKTIEIQAEIDALYPEVEEDVIEF
ncbi:MAG TPA: N-6 DNA methylase [Brevefilum fermentans]|nr:N-6 DNA methylase [Brevefilum fermentans]